MAAVRDRLAEGLRVCCPFHSVLLLALLLPAEVQSKQITLGVVIRQHRACRKRGDIWGCIS